MRIAQINSVYGKGSTGKIAQDVYLTLSSEGHECKVFFGRGETSDNKDIIKISSKLDNILDGVYTRLLNRHGEVNIQNTKNLINQLNEFEPDIIHLHNIHGYYLNYAVLFDYLKKSKIPIVWLMHDQWPISGGAAYFDVKMVDWKNPNQSHLNKLKKEYPASIFANKKSSIRNYSRKEKIFTIDNLTIVTPSQWLKDVLQQSFFKNIPIQVINNGINLSIFKSCDSFFFKKNKILLGVASVWDNRKGLKYFVKLAEDLPEEYEIILVGVTSQQANNLPNRIKTIPKTHSVKELVELYSQADLFVNPTLEDNFPTVNIESQACGTPVVTYDTGGSGESITSLTGKVIKKGNYEALRQAIIDWPKKSKKISDNCCNNARQYSKERMMSEYMKLYKNILQQ